MIHSQIDFKEVGGFSKLFIDYLSDNEALQEFFVQKPNLEGFANHIKNRSFDPETRKLLVKTLSEQYRTAVPESVALLAKENTFSVCTGHQLNLLTGPLYSILKIAATIKLAAELKRHFPECNFVPVYWMASEDHDFDEISYCQVFGKKYQWETQQKGAVGRMNPQEILAVFEAFKDLPEFFKNAYTNAETLADAARTYVHEIFKGTDLVVIDADSAALKSVFKKTIKADIFEGLSFEKVNQTTQKLQELGYKTQVNPREINFFYLMDGLRERIVEKDGAYEVLNSTIRFSKAEMEAEIEAFPERFSPNVILRPIYQESILPNLAYLGGPAELVYWLQLKSNFDAQAVPFPILMPRVFASIINAGFIKKSEKLGVSIAELFKDEVSLKKDFVSQKSDHELSLSSELATLEKAFEGITSKAISIDKTLEAVVLGEKQKVIGILSSLEKRMKKAEERNMETELSQLLGLKEKLFPGGNLQERTENYLTFAINSPEFVPTLIQDIDPFCYKMNIINAQ